MATLSTREARITSAARRSLVRSDRRVAFEMTRLEVPGTYIAEQNIGSPPHGLLARTPFRGRVPTCNVRDTRCTPTNHAVTEGEAHMNNGCRVPGVQLHTIAFNVRFSPRRDRRAG